MGDLVSIRSALCGLLTTVVDETNALVTYQATPHVGGWDAARPVLRVEMRPPVRFVLGAEADWIVQQDGQMVLQWLFPAGTAQAVVQDAIEATAKAYRAQTLDGGLSLPGDCQTARMGHDSGRIRWDVTVPWRVVDVGRTAGDTAPRTTLPTTAQAFATARGLWAARIEQATPAESWPGLRTFYDDDPTWQRPPALPWAGVWVDASAIGGQEVQSPTVEVLARMLVQVHTDQSLGQAAALAIADRIAAVFAVQIGGVSFLPVQVTRQSQSPAGTFQTNLRIPFRFERARPS